MKSYLLLLFALATSLLSAQEIFPELSPQCAVSQKIGFTFITINYERPAARGRKVFGELVPYNQLWRTGAGYCTKIGFDNSVTVGNTKIGKGTYSLFTIPGKKEWTIIFNRDTTLYGVKGYDEQNDAVRIKVIPQTTQRHYESLSLDIEVIPNNARIYISWEQTQLSFDLVTETDEKVTAFIRSNLLTGQSSDSENYALAAEYYYFLNTHLDEALNLINKAISKQNESWYYRQKIDILERQGKYQEAIDCADKIILITNQRSDWDAMTKQQSIDFYRERKTLLKSKSKHRPSE